MDGPDSDPPAGYPDRETAVGRGGGVLRRWGEVDVYDGGVLVLPRLFEALVLRLDVLEGGLLVRNVGVHAEVLKHSARLGLQVVHPQELSCK